MVKNIIFKKNSMYLVTYTICVTYTNYSLFISSLLIRSFCSVDEKYEYRTSNHKNKIFIMNYG